MSLLSYETYVRLSGDATTASADAEAAMDDAVSMLDDVLNRSLVEAERTEQVRIGPTGHVTPRAVPITAVPAEAAYQIGTSHELRFVTYAGDAPFFDTLDWRYFDYDNDYPARWARTTLTYTGGFTEATLPFRLKKAICLLAQAFVTDPTGLVDSQVTNKTVGDVSISFSPQEAEGIVDHFVPGLWCTIQGFRRPVL